MRLWFLQYISRVAWQTHRFFQPLESKRLHHLSEEVGGPGWLPKGAWCSWPSTFLFRLAGQISLHSPRLGASFAGWIYFPVPVSAPLVETGLTSRVSESAIWRENEKQDIRIQRKARIRGPTPLQGEGAETESKPALLYFQPWMKEYTGS